MNSKTCNNCRANKICDHNKYGFENCGNHIPSEVKTLGNKKKFVMPLTWHNCKTYPPSEIENSFLLITNGENTYGASWHKASGYYIAYNEEDVVLDVTAWENWWWADIEQTIKGCAEFTTNK
jgi:hypothetical protein